VATDSPSSGDGYPRTCAITMYGAASVLDEGDPLSEAFRARHLAHNPSQGVFIMGPGIAMVAISVEYAQICDSKDKVSNWSAAEGWGTRAR